MQAKILPHASLALSQNPQSKPLSSFNTPLNQAFFSTPPCLSIPHLSSRRAVNRLAIRCVRPGQELVDSCSPTKADGGGASFSDSSSKHKDEEGGGGGVEGKKMVMGVEEPLPNRSLLSQMKEIIKFTGPATGLWICGPLMSLIDTAVIGQGSSIELAALGPGTVITDSLGYVFMFLSVATSNMVATSLAREDKEEVQHHISVLLFIGFTCGVCMLFFTRFFGSWLLKAFTGPNNVHIVPAANAYVQIRGLAWPAVLVGWVAQSASLGMKDSWEPLKALIVASAVNGIGDVVLCSLLGYGIAGAAWATMVSQVFAAYMMISALTKKGYNAFSISIPSLDDLATIFGLAAPVFVMMISKVAFYALIIYFATSMGTYTAAAHQVMIQIYCMCTVWGEPLCQAAQSFMPELMYGTNRSLLKAGMLLKSLVILGVVLGLALGIVGTSVPWLFPNLFTPDQKVIREMHKVLVPYFLALAVTPATLGLEGTLLAGRDLTFASLSMSTCFSLGALVLLLVSNGGYGLPGCWCALVGFQWARFFLSAQRLLSPSGILFTADKRQYKLEEVKGAWGSIWRLT